MGGGKRLCGIYFLSDWQRTGLIVNWVESSRTGTAVLQNSCFLAHLSKVQIGEIKSAETGEAPR